jgi:hypothetical protein
MGRFEDYGFTGLEEVCFRHKKMARITWASQSLSTLVELKKKKDILLACFAHL